MNKNHILMTMIIGLTIVSQLSSSYAALQVKDPTQFQNELWTVTLGDSNLDVSYIAEIPGESDSIAMAVGNLGNYNSFTLFRLADNGSLIWQQEIVKPDSMEGLIDAATESWLVVNKENSVIAFLVEGRSGSPGYTHHLFLYEYYLNGTYKNRWMVRDADYGASSDVYVSLTYNPTEPQLYYIAISDLIGGSNYDVMIFSWNTQTASEVLINTFSTYYTQRVVKISYISSINRLILLLKCGNSASYLDVVSILLRFEPIANAPLTNMMMSGTGGPNLLPCDVEFFNDKYYFMGVNISGAHSQNKLFIEIYDITFSKDKEFIFAATGVSTNYQNLVIVDPNHLYIVGYSYADYYRDISINSEIFVQAYKFSVDKDELFAIGSWRISSGSIGIYWGSSYVAKSGNIYLGGQTQFQGGGEITAYVSKYPSLLNNLTLSSESGNSQTDITNTSAGDQNLNFNNLIERFLEQDWIIGGLMALSGLLIGGLLIGLISKRK